MSELDKVRSIVRRLGLSKEAAKAEARKAFRADLTAGRPDKSLKCAREFDLGNVLVNEAAVELFVTLVRRGRFEDAYRILKNYNLLEAGPEAQVAIDLAGRLDKVPVTLQLTDGDRTALAKIVRRAHRVNSRRLKVHDADLAIAMIRRAAAVRDIDDRVRGRAVMLPSEGDVMLTGDLHGNTDNLLHFMQLADLDRHPKRIVVIQEILHARRLEADERDLSFVTILHALDWIARYPGQIYYLIGNHDLGFHLGRDLVKAGKSLNRYLFRGMSFQFKDRYEEVVAEYKRYIAGMPAAIISQNGVFMSHSTPKRAFIDSLSQGYLTETAARLPYSKCKPIVALVNGRDYAAETAEHFADRLGCEHMICGHTPTVKGLRVPNQRHLIIDSQHGNGRYIRFDLDRHYTHDELVSEVESLHRKAVPLEELGELV